MTISKAIITILSEYEGLKIDTDHIADGADQYGLFKSPAREVQDFNDGSYSVKETYQFLARYDSNSDSARREADEWLEDLTYWADDYAYKNEFPEIGNGREIKTIDVVGVPYPIEANNREILYQMSLQITYIREREE